jgi:uncharacterized SAM-binding protein YcdF (DUF218 family)
VSPIEGAIVILGSPNSDSGELSTIAQERSRLGAELYHQYPSYFIIPTGGFGSHFNRSPRPHGAYVRDHLIRLGVPAASIAEHPVESANTIEDARLLLPVLDRLKPRRVLAITSDYHLDRAKFVFDHVIPQEVTWHSTPTDESNCSEDLSALREHERRALARLKTQGIPT